MIPVFALKYRSARRAFLPSFLGLGVLLSSIFGMPASGREVLEWAAPDLESAGGVVNKNRSPLVDAFEDHHFEAILGLLAYVRDGLNEAAGDGPRPLLSGNPAGGFHYGRWIEEARYFDFLNVELDVAGLADHRDHFLAINGLAEGVGSALLVMPNARSNAQWREQEDPFAYARGTGLTYALGGHMHVPWCLYDGSQYHRFYGSLEGHQPIFRMIEKHGDFLDGYVPLLWHVVEVPYGADGIGSVRTIEKRMGELFDAGVPALVRLRARALVEGNSAVEESALRDLDRQRFGADRFVGEPRGGEVLGGGRTEVPASPFVSGDDFSLHFYPPIPRVSAEPSETPLVLHLVRRADGGPLPQGMLTVTVRRSLLGNAEVTNVDLASVEWEGSPPAQVEWETNKEGDLVLRVGGIQAWGLLRIHTRAATAFPRLVRDSLREQMAESEVPIMRMIRFNNKWRRPQWVDDLLAAPDDPLDGYFIDRISWSYDTSPDTLGHAKEHGWAFHGSVALLHSWMTNPERSHPKTGDMLAFPPDWTGWARYPGGGPMLIRGEWNPPRYGASFASQAYREAVLARCLEWVEMGAAGIQLDDVSGMLNRVWQYGGDFSDGLFEGFRDALVAQGFPGVTSSTDLEELRRRVVREMGWVNASWRVDASPQDFEEGAGWIAVPYEATSAYYPGQVWVNSPVLDAGGLVRAEWLVRFTGGPAPYGDFRLMDGYGSEWFAAFAFRDGRLHVHTPEESLENLGIAVPADEWVALGMEVDFDSGTFKVRVGDGSSTGPFPFAVEWPREVKTFLFGALADPLRGGMEVKRLRVERKGE
jgi:hypothetical protein